ncbi:MAG: carbohydrate porin [Myxococcota bacterium]
MLVSSLASEDSLGAEGFVHRSNLSGDWGGLRSSLEERGVSLEFFYTADAVFNMVGGLETGLDALGNLDLVLELDLDQLLGWPGGRLSLYGLGTHGGRPSERVGDVQGFNNIEAPYGWRLFEAYVAQSLFQGKLDVLAGLYDVTSEFDVAPTAAVFVQSSFGTGGEFGNSGINGPSTFPQTSLGLRFEIRPTPALFGRLVVADGVPGNPDRPGRTSIRLGDGDGILVVGEIGWINIPGEAATRRVERRFNGTPAIDSFGYYGKFAVGAYGYTTRFEDATSSRRGAYGGYGLAQQAIYREADRPSEGLNVFFRFGAGSRRGHLVNGYVGGGLVYRGVSDWRPKDALGLAVAAAHPVDASDWETAVELTYRLPIFGWWSLQPDIQWVIVPAGDPSIDHAVAFTLRSQLRI